MVTQAKPLRRFKASLVSLLIALAVVVVGVSVALLALQRNSAAQYERASEADQVIIQSYGLMGAGWRAVIAHAFGAPGAPPAAASEEAVASIEYLRTWISNYQESYTERSSDRLSGLMREYEALAQRQLDLVQAGRGEEAFGVALAALGTFSELQSVAQDEAAQFAANAERVANATTFASILVLLVGAVILGFLMWRFHIALQRIDRVELANRSEARFRRLVQNSADVIALLDDKGRVKYASPAIERLLGVTPEDIANTVLVRFVHGDDRDRYLAFWSDVRIRPGYTGSTEIRFMTPSGDERYVEITSTDLLDDPGLAGVVFNIHDVSERKLLENELRHQAFHDPLTDLANRARFLDRLAHALLRRKREAQLSIAVLYVDLDFFKSINDEFGHTAGDEVLQKAAQRLQLYVRPEDTVARLGGDEFAILLEGVSGEMGARRTAERILHEIRKPFTVNGREIFVSACIGIVWVDSDGMTIEDVVRDADLAMYDAKRNGRGRVEVYLPGRHYSFADRAHLISDLNRAVEHGEFELHYQPIVSLSTEKIEALEALVRWRHPDRGLVHPQEFVPLAEETGAIVPIGEWVLREACLRAREWQALQPGVRVSVNVSVRQLEEPGFAELVRDALEKSGLQPKDLILEITETAFIANSEAVAATLRNLNQSGIRVSLDDFGTGYSSLSQLRNLPVSVLKIDKAFIDAIDRSEIGQFMVGTVVELARLLNLEIVAEGIERPEQLARLKALGCDMGQGYLFWKPMDELATARLVERSGGSEYTPPREVA